MQRWLEQQAETLKKEYDKANTPQPGAEPTRLADPDAGAGPSSGVESTPSFSRFSSLTSALTPTLDLSKQLGEITSVGKQITSPRAEPRFSCAREATHNSSLINGRLPGAKHASWRAPHCVVPS